MPLRTIRQPDAAACPHPDHDLPDHLTPDAAGDHEWECPACHRTVRCTVLKPYTSHPGWSLKGRGPRPRFAAGRAAGGEA